MIKLANILSEIRVNQPINIFPKDLIQKIIDINPWLMTAINSYENLDDFLKGEGYPSLEEYLYDMGYGDEDENGTVILDKWGQNLLQYFPLYYKLIKKGDVLIIYFEGNDDVNATSTIPYKNINVIALEDGDGYILYCNNF